MKAISIKVAKAISSFLSKTWKSPLNFLNSLGLFRSCRHFTKCNPFYRFAQIKVYLGFLFFLVLLFIFGVGLQIPSKVELQSLAQGSDKILLDRTGQVLQMIRTDFQKRRLAWLPLQNFSKELREAVVRIEDHRFYSHGGVDPVGLGRAIYRRLTEGRREGGSTITMQLVELMNPEFLNGHRRPAKGKVFNKIQQIGKALLIDALWSKEEILEAYLNLVPLRGETQGAPAFIAGYFHKSPLLLDEYESLVTALLIASPNMKLEQIKKKLCYWKKPSELEEHRPPRIQNPEGINTSHSQTITNNINPNIIANTNPNTNSNTPNNTKSAVTAINRSTQFNTRPGFSQSDRSLVCEPIERWVDENLSPSPNIKMPLARAPHLAQRLFQPKESDSLISTTIESSIQERVTQILETQLARLKNFNVNDGAAIVIDNNTGDVLAYVGGLSNSKASFVDGVRAQRQAGSALKPFLYAKALDLKRITPASVLLDDPTVLTWDHQTYRPANYDKQFNGPVSVREALASSLNVPAVKVVTMIGLHNAYQTLQNIGLTRLKEPDFYGVSLALGAVEVSLDELANAYRIFTQGGRWTPLKWTLARPYSEGSSQEQSDGPISEESKQNKLYREVFSSATSYLIQSILSDPQARTLGFSYNSPLETPFWTFVKTGTSKDYRDNWCIGGSEKYTVGVWAGNFDASPMKEVSGVTGAGPVWFDIMEMLHRGHTSRPPAPPKGVVQKLIQHPWRRHNFNESFLAGTEPLVAAMELAPKEGVRFVFPTEGARLIKDPYLDPKKIGLRVKLIGDISGNKKLYLDGIHKGSLSKSLVIDNPDVGLHTLEVLDDRGARWAKVSFTVFGLKENSVKEKHRRHF